MFCTGEETLLDIVTMPNGTAAAGTEAILNTLERFHITKDQIVAGAFDTTNTNR